MGEGCLFCFTYVTENSSFCLFSKSMFLFIYLAVLDLKHAGSLVFIVACGPFCFFFFFLRFMRFYGYIGPLLLLEDFL